MYDVRILSNIISVLLIIAVLFVFVLVLELIPIIYSATALSVILLVVIPLDRLVMKLNKGDFQ